MVWKNIPSFVIFSTCYALKEVYFFGRYVIAFYFYLLDTRGWDKKKKERGGGNVRLLQADVAY